MDKPASVSTDWEPIKTAPKDGTYVWLRRRAGRISVRARFSNGEAWWAPDELCYVTRPTHWMPLESALSVGAVDPHAEDSGKPPTRDEELS